MTCTLLSGDLIKATHTGDLHTSKTNKKVEKITKTKEKVEKHF